MIEDRLHFFSARERISDAAVYGSIRAGQSCPQRLELAGANQSRSTNP
jgi:hypothetical protein